MLNAVELAHTQRNTFSLIGAACLELKEKTGVVSVEELLKTDAVRAAVRIAAEAYCTPGITEKKLNKIFLDARQEQQRRKVQA